MPGEEVHGNSSTSSRSTGDRPNVLTIAAFGLASGGETGFDIESW